MQSSPRLGNREVEKDVNPGWIWPKEAVRLAHVRLAVWFLNAPLRRPLVADSLAKPIQTLGENLIGSAGLCPYLVTFLGPLRSELSSSEPLCLSFTCSLL